MAANMSDFCELISDIEIENFSEENNNENRRSYSLLKLNTF